MLLLLVSATNPNPQSLCSQPLTFPEPVSPNKQASKQSNKSKTTTGKTCKPNPEARPFVHGYKGTQGNTTNWQRQKGNVDLNTQGRAG